MADSKEVIQNRMLTKIPDDYDKTEGSFFYDATKPVAIELEILDSKSDSILDKGFADTAAGTDLEKICGERGVYRKQATKSSGTVTVTGVVGAAITSGEIVASDNVNFIFSENKVIPVGGSINVNVECEQYGTIGNVPAGAIKYFPKTLEGLQTVTNALAIANGYDAETDESLRERFYVKVQTPATSGNKWHYLNWAKEVVGVGDAKVYPLWNGNGTVKIVIINSNKRAADNALIDDVVNYIEDNRPIGATVTVVSATEKAINISVSLTIDANNYSIDQVKANIEANIEANITEYLKDVAFNENISYVSYAIIGSTILGSEGVLDYSNLQVNGGTVNIVIADNEAAVLGGVVIG